VPVAVGPHEWENCVASAKPAPQVSPRGGPAAGDAMGASKFGSRLPRSPGKYPAKPGDGGVVWFSSSPLAGEVARSAGGDVGSGLTASKHASAFA
jgi:hypothetical protein